MASGLSGLGRRGRGDTAVSGPVVSPVNYELMELLPPRGGRVGGVKTVRTPHHRTPLPLLPINMGDT